MATIGQFIYRNETDIPTSIALNSIKKIGIQGPVGMKFSFNGGSAIQIGVTGIYELDFSDIQNGSITGSLSIDKSTNSLPSSDFTILIDYVTREEEEKL